VNFKELPIVFDCEGSELVGMIHLPESPCARGMLSIVAGGPQYRGGVGRLQVQMARQLAAAGVPVMRFDYRGLGDGEGRFRGFQDVEADLRAAVRAFRESAPQVREVVLWGGCDAAAAIMINAWKLPEVTGIVTGNPWVHTAETGDAVIVKHHFRKRMKETDFWLKVLRLKYNPLPALATLARSALYKLRPRRAEARSASGALDDPSKPFVPRMRVGLTQFKGDMLLLMSGHDYIAREFDEVTAASRAWDGLLDSPRLLRRDIEGADHTFSKNVWKHAASDAIVDWLRRW